MRMKIYELKNGDFALFDTETLRIWKIPGEKIEKLKEDIQRPDFEVVEQLGLPVNNPELICEQEAFDPTYFDTLILHITDCCNMQCKYCYESFDECASKKDIMTPKVALNAIKLYYSKYTYIREIKFFGGEPALNQNVIKVVCEYIDELHKNGKIIKKPVFKIITNGTVMNTEFMDLIRKHNIKVVFSIDGNETMHNSLRVYPKGKKTFKTIYDNFMMLREYTENKQPYSINTTYTGMHEEMGISINDVLWELSDMFPVAPKKINIHLVTALPTDKFSLKGDYLLLKSAENALERAREGDSRTHTRLRAVVRRLRKGGVITECPCPSAVTWSAVSCNGDVYPCMMFVNREDCFMGNVKEDIFETEQYHKVIEKFQDIKKSQYKCCENCIARNVCAPCMGVNEFETGSMYPKSSKSCNEFKKIVEIAVKGIAEGVW